MELEVRPGLHIWSATIVQKRRNLCIVAVTGRNLTVYDRFLKVFHGLADIPTVFQKKIYQTLENKHPACSDI